MSQSNQIPPPAVMMQMITGFWTSCCIYSAAKLSIADHLAQGPQTATQLAEATHCHTPSLYRVLRALASTGIFAENEAGQFSLTPLGATLQSNVPGSMRAMAIAQLGDHYNAWGNLLYSIKTGKTAFDHVQGMPVWQYYETHPDEGANFMQAMSGLTQAALMNILPAYDFSAFDTIVDIGGGNGALLTAILKATPSAKGIVFDEEYVIERARQSIIQNGLSEQCTTVAGNFFEEIPVDADAYLLKMVLHDWDDEQSVAILRNCYKSMKQGSKLLIIESVIPSGNTPHPGKFMDINMLAMTGGRERTQSEFISLLEKAGLAFNRVIHTHSPMFSIVEAEKK